MNKLILISKPLFLSLLILVTLIAKAQTEQRIAPDFNLPDINGKMVSLADFKGKIVYIDIWATWCGPCVAEIPHSKKLHEQFKDNPNIAFVNISFDRDTAQWKKKVLTKQMTGTQLISIEGRESSVQKNYEVTTIPRFIIIDKNGKIQNYNAKRPSERGLAKELTKLLEE